MDLDAVRQELMERGLDEADAATDPLDQFNRWFAEVERVGLYQPESMVLATVASDGSPSARYVLLRGVDQSGFRFFSDAGSDKGRDLAEDDRVALVFTWHGLSRQVRVRGRARPLDAATVDAYWASRPRGSQLAATASAQSRPVADRAALDQRYVDAEAAVGDGAIARPRGWVGWCVEPTEIEFWQGRAFRFHDRLRYRRAGTTWEIERLQP
jgi:pyridoxamine 5'-phosphate oxidase